MSKGRKLKNAALVEINSSRSKSAEVLVTLLMNMLFQSSVMYDCGKILNPSQNQCNLGASCRYKCYTVHCNTRITTSIIQVYYLAW